MHGVGGGQDFGFVDVVYAEGFEDLVVSTVSELVAFRGGRYRGREYRLTWHSTK